MRIRILAVTGALAMALSGCGDSPLEQGLFGAGAGATTAAVLDADIGTGAVLGAVGNIAYCRQFPERC
jgi:hypothetical protein